MATAVVMPKQGQSVESCLIVGWKKSVGDQVSMGETLCEVETDKALLEVESPASGTVLALFYQEGDEVPVLTNIAAIGQPTSSTTATAKRIHATTVRRRVSGATLMPPRSSPRGGTSP